MKIGFLRVYLAVCLAAGGITLADAKGNDVLKSFTIKIGNKQLFIASPTSPDNEFITYRPVLPLNDIGVFEKTNRITALNVHWTYRTGLMRMVAGVVELKVNFHPAEENDVSSDVGLRNEILESFKRELKKVGFDGSPVQFNRVAINDKNWLTYVVPVLGIREYAIGISSSRFITIQVAFIDNTGENMPEWRKEAAELMTKVLGSIQLE